LKIISIRNSIILTAVISFALSSSSQINSWTKSTSGSWHEPFWSLGVLPDANQSHITVKNAGWKAVAIDRVTARDFPESLNIPRLTVSSPTNTMNTLMLNFAGLQSPLRVAGDFDLGSNSVLLTISSALEVGGSFLIDGTVNHDNASSVSASIVHVGDTSPGNYHFNNGTVRTGDLIVGDGTSGRFNQSSATSLSVSNRLIIGRGDYPRTFREGDGFFDLAAGTVTARIIQIGEQNGRLGPAGADGTFVQTGGSNFAGGLLLGWPESDASSGNNYTYILRDGLLATSNTIVYGGNGHFAQAGGLHRVEGPLAVAGFYGRSFTPFTAQYTLSGGVVTARSLNIDFGAISQMGGTNEIAGDMVVGLKEAFTRHAFYSLNRGKLSTSNSFVFDSAKGSIAQSGGEHAVGNLLEIAGSSSNLMAGYTLFAGDLTAHTIRVSTNATFMQWGGAVNATVMNIAQGEFNLTSGDLAAAGVSVGDGRHGAFVQRGGRLYASNGVVLGLPDHRYHIDGHGEFTLENGVLTATRIQIGTLGRDPIDSGSTGSFVQSGGSNIVGALNVAHEWSANYDPNTYQLSGGVLATTNTAVNPGADFYQSAGMHVVDGSLTVRGTLNRYSTVGSGYYLTNGTLRSRSLMVGPVAGFLHYDGTNEVDGELVVGGDLFLGGSGYHFAGGLLRTGNAIVEGSLYNDITQTGGVHNVTGTLTLQRPITYYSGQSPVAVRYALDAGQLNVRDIRVSTNAVFRHGNGVLSHTGTLTLEGGTWQAAAGEQQLGALRLAAPNIESSLLLTNSPTALRLGRSAALPWDVAATLIIKNWMGSTNGNGFHRIIFGADETALTSQQLAQIRFRNPAGLPAGEYSATILNTGEIVPLQPTGRNPSIAFSQNPGQLQLTWPIDYTLQSSTNVLGPFEDMNMTSPKTFGTTYEPRRFFRLRKSD
jgi:hypothetical protein